MTDQQKTKGFSLIELLIVVAIILIIASIAIPNLLRSKQSANEAAAVSVLRNVHNAQAVYIVEYTSSVGYANSLIKLGPGNPCTKLAACLTDQLVGCAAEPCLKSGYMFYMSST
jgi:type IV pilus assembly protein PilA